MNGAGHRAVAAATALTLAHTTHAPVWQYPLTIGLAIATSAGPTSPDVDQTRAWRRLDRWIPDEALGDGGPLQHRGITHSWLLPLLALIATHVLVPADTRWIAHAALVGWTSHLVADLVFGREGAGRGPGIPLLGWTRHIGCGLPVGGLLERAVTAIAVPATVAVLAWQGTGWVGLDHATTTLTRLV